MPVLIRPTDLLVFPQIILDHVNLNNIWLSFYIPQAILIYANTLLSLSQLNRALYMGFPGGSVVKNPPGNARDTG